MPWLSRIACSIVVSLLAAVAMASPPVRVFTTAYPPYASPELPAQGVAVGMLREILAAEGHEIRVDFQPWARLGAELKARRYDIVLLAWPGDLKSHGLLGGTPWFESRLGFYVRRADWRSDGPGLPGLAGKRIGIVKDYAYPDALLNSGLSIETASTDEQNLRKLSAGRIDAVVLERAVGQYLLRRSRPGIDPQALLWQEPALAAIPIYAAVVPGQPRAERLQQLLARGLQALKDSGHYRLLMQEQQLDAPPEVRARAPARP